MKKTQIAAIKSILSERGKPENHRCFVGLDKTTRRFYATDAFSLVMYENATDEEIDVFRNDDSIEFRDNVNATSLLKAFDEQFHEYYSDDCYELVAPKTIAERYKAAKADKSGDDLWRRVEKFGICYNVEYLKNVCNALGTKTVGIYYPTDKKKLKPIVVVAIDDSTHSSYGIGVIMPMAL